MFIEMLVWMAKSIFTLLHLPGKLAFEIITLIIEVALLLISRCSRKLLFWGILIITATEALNFFAEDATMIALEWLLLLIRMLYVMTAENGADATMTIAIMNGLLLAFALRMLVSGRTGRRWLYTMPPLATGRFSVYDNCHTKSYAHTIIEG